MILASKEIWSEAEWVTIKRSAILQRKLECFLKLSRACWRGRNLVLLLPDPGQFEFALHVWQNVFFSSVRRGFKLCSVVCKRHGHYCLANGSTKTAREVQDPDWAFVSGFFCYRIKMHYLPVPSSTCNITITNAKSQVFFTWMGNVYQKVIDCIKQMVTATRTSTVC